MRNQEMNLDPEDREIESALAGLKPTPPNRDAMMFAAGARSARHSLRVWRGVAAVLALSTGLSLTLHRTAPPPHLAVAPTVAAPTFAPPVDVTTGPFTAASLRAIVLERGIDALPSTPGARNSLPQTPTPSIGRLENPS